MMKLNRWLYNSYIQQLINVSLSFIVLLYSIISLFFNEKILSIVFIFLATVMFITAVLNRKHYVMRAKLSGSIRIIQKQYDNHSTGHAFLQKLSPDQKRLWQYIVNDYSIEELQYVFSLTLGGLSSQVKKLLVVLELEVGRKLKVETVSFSHSKNVEL